MDFPLLLTGFSLSSLNIIFKTKDDVKNFKPKELILVRGKRKLKVKLGKFAATVHSEGYALNIALNLQKETVPEEKNLKAVDLIEDDLVITLYTKGDSSEFASARLSIVISNCFMQKNVEQLKTIEECKLTKPSTKKTLKEKSDSLLSPLKEEPLSKSPESSEPPIQ